MDPIDPGVRFQLGPRLGLAHTPSPPAPLPPPRCMGAPGATAFGVPTAGWVLVLDWMGWRDHPKQLAMFRLVGQDASFALGLVGKLEVRRWGQWRGCQEARQTVLRS